MSNPSQPRSGNQAFLDDLISQSLATTGGHLWINPSQWTLYVSWGRSISGHDLDAMKARVLAAGGAVIDVRQADPDQVLHLAFNGPMIAVGEEPRFIICKALSYKRLETVAAHYRRAGAEIHNIPVPQEAGDDTLSLPT
jgi:hypothetical protein